MLISILFIIIITRRWCKRPKLLDIEKILAVIPKCLFFFSKAQWIFNAANKLRLDICHDGGEITSLSLIINVERQKEIY